jgi:hypothetical protein
MQTLFLCLTVMFLTGCVALAPTPTPSLSPEIVVENAGYLCFSRYDVTSSELSGTFRPKGCFSTTCTARLETTFSAVLFPDETALRFAGRFVLRDTTVRFPVAQACAADCMGGGTYPFTLSNVIKGTPYSIWLGARRLGELVPEKVPTPKEFPLCFGETH